MNALIYLAKNFDWSRCYYTLLLVYVVLISWNTRWNFIFVDSGLLLSSETFCIWIFDIEKWSMLGWRRHTKAHYSVCCTEKVISKKCFIVICFLICGLYIYLALWRTFHHVKYNRWNIYVESRLHISGLFCYFLGALWSIVYDRKLFREIREHNTPPPTASLPPPPLLLPCRLRQLPAVSR